MKMLSCYVFYILIMLVSLEFVVSPEFTWAQEGQSAVADLHWSDYQVKSWLKKQEFDLEDFWFEQVHDHVSPQEIENFSNIIEHNILNDNQVKAAMPRGLLKALINVRKQIKETFKNLIDKNDDFAFGKERFQKITPAIKKMLLSYFSLPALIERTKNHDPYLFDCPRTPLIFSYPPFASPLAKKGIVLSGYPFLNQDHEVFNEEPSEEPSEDSHQEKIGKESSPASQSTQSLFSSSRFLKGLFLGYLSFSSLIQNVSGIPSIKSAKVQENLKYWINLERIMNVEQRPLAPIHYDVTKVPVADANVNLMACAPKYVEDLIYDKDKKNVYIPVHPFNDDPTVPGFNLPCFKSLPALHTASRSSVLIDEEGNILPLTIKAATNFLSAEHVQREASQPSKVDLTEEVIISRSRSDYIKKMDELIGTDPQLTILTELASVALKDGGNGYILRDLSPLQREDVYYLPAFSINPNLPWGREIALQNGAYDVMAFWGKHYAYALGKAKAKMLLRYGLQMETPNSQNMLIEMTREGSRPTGNLIFRDLSDAIYVRPVVTSILENTSDEDPIKSYYQRDVQIKYTIDESPLPFFMNSIFRMDSPNRPHEFDNWGKEHTQGYLDTINEDLGLAGTPDAIKIQTDAPLDRCQYRDDNSEIAITSRPNYYCSPAGILEYQMVKTLNGPLAKNGLLRQAIKNYHSHLRLQESARKLSSGHSKKLDGPEKDCP